MLSNRFTVTVVGILAAVIGLVWFIASLYGDISDLEDTVDDRDKTIQTITTQKANAEAEVALKKADVERLKLKIVEQNHAVEEFKSDASKLRVEIEKWKSKPPEIKYVNKEVIKVINKAKNPTNNLCQDLIDMNNAVKEINYEDL